MIRLSKFLICSEALIFQTRVPVGNQTAVLLKSNQILMQHLSTSSYPETRRSHDSSVLEHGILARYITHPFFAIYSYFPFTHPLCHFGTACLFLVGPFRKKQGNACSFHTDIWPLFAIISLLSQVFISVISSLLVIKTFCVNTQEDK